MTKTAEQLKIELENLHREYMSLKESFEKDLAERIRAEQALIISESNLQALINNKSQSIWSLDRNYNLIVCNDYFRQAFLAAYRHELKLGENLLELLSPELTEYWKPKYDEALDGNPVAFGFSADLQGKVYHYQVFLSPIYTERSVTGVSALSIDITERKVTEEALRQSERMLKESQSAAHLGSFEWDLITGEWKSSEILDQIYGIGAEYTRNLQGWLDLIYPGCREPMQDYFLKNIVKEHERFDREFKIVRKNDQQIRWVHGIGAVEANPDQNTIRFTGTLADITSRKNAEEALKMSESNLQALINNKDESVWSLDRNYSLIVCNDFFRKSYKAAYGIDLNLGINLVEILSPELRALWKPKYDAALKGEKITFEFSEKIHGATFYFDIFLNPIFSEGKITGVTALSIDITEWKKADEFLRAQQFRNSQIINNAPFGSHHYRLDPDNTLYFTGANPAADKILGIEHSRLIGKTIEEAFPALVQTEIPLKYRSIASEGGRYDVEDIQYEDGKIMGAYEVHAFQTDHNQMTVFFTEITSRKKAEETLVKAKEKAEESDRLKSSFLANMSHEIRTPMNGILGFAELLKNPMLTPAEQKEYIDVIEKSGIRMLNILNDLIDLSRIESGHSELYLSEFNINSQLDFIHSFFKPEAEKKGLSLKLFTPLPDKKANFVSDREKINAILTNLVKNAIKFTYKGEIEFGYHPKEDGIEFFVKDTGVGISPEQTEYIFERFRQGSESLSRNYEGAGLGLAISKSYVQLLGGIIRVESNNDQAKGNTGSVFYFIIPPKEKTPDKNETAELFNPIKKTSGRKLGILLAEDDEASRILMSKYLDHICKKIHYVRTGREAVDFCRAHPELDLVLMDLKMPEMDGFEAIRLIREFNKKITIIAQTAYAQAYDQQKAIQAGCNYYLSKPIEKKQFHQIIEKYFP